MRYAILALCGALAAAPVAGRPPGLDRLIPGDFAIADPRALDACRAALVVDDIARARSAPAGFESLARCALGPRQALGAAPHLRLSALTGRQLLNRMLARMPRYVWREVRGVPVVRPAGAWTNPHDLLNRRVPAFHLEGRSVPDALAAALGTLAASPPRSTGDGSGALHRRSVTLDFGGGTVVEALSAIVAAHGGAEWRVGYGGGGATIAVSTIAFPGETVSVATTVVAAAD